jgi:hypothetical protein
MPIRSSDGFSAESRQIAPGAEMRRDVNSLDFTNPAVALKAGARHINPHALESTCNYQLAEEHQPDVDRDEHQFGESGGSIHLCGCRQEREFYVRQRYCVIKGIK